jgi:hypothetical protein
LILPIGSMTAWTMGADAGTKELGWMWKIEPVATSRPVAMGRVAGE